MKPTAEKHPISLSSSPQSRNPVSGTTPVLIDVSNAATRKTGDLRSDRVLLWLCLFASISLCSGCMHRRMTIRSDPPGALVRLEGEDIGYTPVSIDYTYYGKREITLLKDGYETLTVLQPVPPPWYQVLPFEFVSDNVALTKINDRRDFTYRLQPQRMVPTQELIERANGLRSEAQIP